MEDYRLEQTGQETQDILNGAAMQSDVTAEKERAELAEQTLQGHIDDEETRAKGVEGTLQDNIDAEEARAKAAEKQNADDIDAIEAKIPSGATSENPLTTKEYVDDSIATASATFRGTYNLVSDLHLTIDASHAQIANALGLAVSEADNNDYAFVQVPTSAETPTEISKIERYKFNGSAWSYEYDLNNSGFTSDQWDAINSGITSGYVTKLAALPTNAELTTLLNGKQNTLTFDSVPVEGSNNPVKSGGVYSAIDDEKGARLDSDAALSQAIEGILALIPSAATALNQLADKAFVNSSIATATAIFRGTYNLVSDLHLTPSATHAQIATALGSAISSADNNDYCFVQVPTSVDTPTEIAVTERYKFDGSAWAYEYDLNNSGFTSAQWSAINSGITLPLVGKLTALPTNTELTDRLTSDEGNISDNAQDIAELQEAYSALTQSDIVIVTGALPASGQLNTIYRQPDQDHTPPQFYSDYMWNGTAWVLMATYDNAIDDVPTAGSGNLVKSGGVYKVTDYNKVIVIKADSEHTGWNTLPRPVKGLVRVTSANSIHLAVSGNISNTDIVLSKGDFDYVQSIINLEQEYDTFANSGSEAIIECLDISELTGLCDTDKNLKYFNWQMGYYYNNAFVSSAYPDRVFASINVEVGKLYLLPLSYLENTQPIVNLDANDNFVSNANILAPKTLTILENTYAIVKAETPKIGVTYATRLVSLSAGVTLNGLYKLPYYCLSDCDALSAFNILNLDAVRNALDLFDFSLTTVTSLNGGYFTRSGVLRTDSYGNWRYAIFDVTPDEWYLINCAILNVVRIFDVDDNNNMTINTSVPAAYYETASNDGTSWALVKPKYSKLGVNVLDPAAYGDKSHQYPKFVKLQRTKNNGLAMLFLQLYTMMEERKEYVVRKAGGGDYTSLTKAIMDNRGKWGVTLHIDEGEYDLLQELTDFYGTSDFLALTPNGRGIELSHNIILEGSPKAVIKANYIGNDANMKEYFSPFNIEPVNNVGGATLMGINIVCSNVRYCVHDEKTGGVTGSYTNIYENCMMYIDNSNNDVWHSVQCIGGGLGVSGSIIIRGCVFKSEGATDRPVVTYHNNSASSAKSIISCMDNYIKGTCGFRFTWYGQSTEMTEVLCAGNNVGRATEFRAETQDTSPNENMELYEWNNVVRAQ